MWSSGRRRRRRKKKGGGGRGGGRRGSSLQAVLYIINYVLLCVQRSVQEAPALLCILTALCKWLAGGNDFREKVTLRPPVHINDSFIHPQVYKSRAGEEGVKVGAETPRCRRGRERGAFRQPPTRSRRKKLPVDSSCQLGCAASHPPV